MASRSAPRPAPGRRLAGLGRSDASLLAGGVAGSTAAAATLVDRHGDELWSFLRHVTASPAGATSAFAATWRAAWPGAATRPGGPLPPWLLGLAWTAAQAALREDRDELRWDTGTPAVDDLPPAARDEPLLAGLHDLDDLERAAVVLEARPGATPASDAAVLGLDDPAALHAARARAHAALAGLRRARDADERAAREAVVAGTPPAKPEAPGEEAPQEVEVEPGPGAGEELAAVLGPQRAALAAALPVALPAAARAAGLGAYAEVKDGLVPPARGARQPGEPWWVPRPGHDPAFGPQDPTDTRLRAGVAVLVALVFAGGGFLATDTLRSAGDDGDAVVTATPVGPLPPGVGRTP